MLVRKSCWQCQLAKFFFLSSRTPFAYGSFDCCMFVCDAILAMTGTDIAAEFRGTYSSQKESRRHGSVRSIAERVTREHGMPEVPVLRAQRGDMALLKRPRDYSLGIFDLSGMAVAAATKKGTVRVPLSEVQRAWRV